MQRTHFRENLRGYYIVENFRFWPTGGDYTVQEQAQLSILLEGAGKMSLIAALRMISVCG